jgi:polysaccharide export outer membrane protein
LTHDDDGVCQFDRRKYRNGIPLKTTCPRPRRIAHVAFPVLWCALLASLLPGCQSTPNAAPTDLVPYITAVLREGDTLKLGFPGAPNMDTTQQVRRDGKITLPFGGEIVAAGKTPADIEQEILKLHGDKLSVKQVVVTVTSSAYPVYVTGAVLRPGKILVDRPMTVLEAIAEAGGFDTAKANPKKVTVLREFEGQTMSYTIDMRKYLKDPSGAKPFYLKPADKIHVPQKFNWF